MFIVFIFLCGFLKHDLAGGTCSPIYSCGIHFLEATYIKIMFYVKAGMHAKLEQVKSQEVVSLISRKKR